jgi:DNA-binding PadR family transcriptional regulator
MSITADLIRGHTDTIILAALLKEDSYGYRINRTLCDLTDGKYELKEATLYTAFKRLEEAGYIHSYWGDEATGARRRYYAITPQGRDAYRRMMREWQEASSMIEKLIRFGDGDGNEEAPTLRI